MTISKLCLLLLRRDLKIALRRRDEWLHPLLFFAMITSLFPLAVTPDPQVLREIAPGIIWVSALLATLLALDSLFRSDFEDGCLEPWLLLPQPLAVLVLAKIAAHWLITAVPLLLIAPVLATLLHLSKEAIYVLCVSLLLGTPVLSLIGAVGTALTVSLKRGGVLLSLLVLPLYVPVLIFGASAVAATQQGFSAAASLLYLLGLLLLGLTLAPFAIAAALRISVSES